MSTTDEQVGIADGTRDLALEVLCTLPCGGERRWYSKRRKWTRGATIVEMAEDFDVPCDAIRVILGELYVTHGVIVGVIAPVTRGDETLIRGGHGAFVPPHNWPHAEAACEAYWENSHG